jgi:hypothetical protein
VNEEEKERVEKINKDNEEIAKLKKGNFFNGGEDQLQLPPATMERVKRKEMGQAQLQQQTASAHQHLPSQRLQQPLYPPRSSSTSGGHRYSACSTYLHPWRDAPHGLWKKAA